MPIEIGPKVTGHARAIAAIEARIARAPGNAGDKPTGPLRGTPAVLDKSPLDPGDAPIDATRVAEIRKAIERGNYPVIPMRVADAMIAAGLLLRTSK